MKYSRFVIKGFTLTELLVAIAVVAILFAIGIPSFKRMLDSNSLKGGSDSLYFMLTLTKIELVKRNNDIYLKIISGTNWCIGVNEGDADCDCRLANSCNVIAINHEKYTNLTLVSNYSTPVFDRVRGTFNEPDKLFRLQSESGGEVQIKINFMGAIRMCGVGSVLDLSAC